MEKYKSFKRSFKYINFIVFYMLLSSCGPESRMVEGFFSIENSSNEFLKLKFFDRTDLSGDEVVNLTSGARISSERFETENLDFFDTDNAIVGSFFGADSVVVVFNNERIFKMHLVSNSNDESRFSDPFSRNILRVGNYSGVGGGEYLYTITQEDYNNATPCDGPCE